MSWHYLQVQEAASSGDCCTGGEPLPPLRSKTTHAEFYYNGKLTESYLASLFGTMYEPLTASHGEDESMSSREVSHAKTSAQPERGQGSQANEADSGATWLESSAMYDLATHSWRTAHSLFPEDSIPCSPILPRSGMMRSGQCWALMMSVLPTEGKESGSWPTPTKSDHKGSGPTIVRKDGKMRGDRLDYAVEQGLHGGTKTRQTFQTPQASDHITKRTSNHWKEKGGVNYTLSDPEVQAAWQTGGTTLGGTVRWPTPRKSDHKGSGQTGKLRDRLDYAVERGGTKTRQTFQTPTVQDFKQQGLRNLGAVGSGKLNPDWVEWLMGWPIGWTSLEPLPEWSSHAWVTGFPSG